jgi:hypothetical protein
MLLPPAAAFMAALLVRGPGAPQAEPARSAPWIVAWYAARLWTLWVLLAALALRMRATGRTVLFAGLLSAAAGIILVVVGAHVLMN